MLYTYATGSMSMDSIGHGSQERVEWCNASYYSHLSILLGLITMPLCPYHPFGTSSRWGSQIFFIEVKTVYSRRLNSCKTYAI